MAEIINGIYLHYNALFCPNEILRRPSLLETMYIHTYELREIWESRNKIKNT